VNNIVSLPTVLAMVNHIHMRNLNRIILIALLVCSSSFLNVSHGIPRSKEQGVVQITSNGDTLADPDIIILALSEAVKANPTAKKIRVSWSISYPMHSGIGTVLYSRQNRTVKLFMHDSIYEHSHTVDYLYESVGDERIHKLVESLKTPKLRSNARVAANLYFDGFLIGEGKRTGYEKYQIRK
jgi:hypothetical protein